MVRSHLAFVFVVVFCFFSVLFFIKRRRWWQDLHGEGIWLSNGHTMIPRKIRWIQFDISSLYVIIHKQWVLIVYIYNHLHMILITYSCISSLYPCDLIFTKMSLRTWTRLYLRPLKFRARLRVCLEAARGDASSASQIGVKKHRTSMLHCWEICEIPVGISHDFTRNTVICSLIERAKIELWH